MFFDLGCYLVGFVVVGVVNVLIVLVCCILQLFAGWFGWLGYWFGFWVVIGCVGVCLIWFGLDCFELVVGGRLVGWFCFRDLGLVVYLLVLYCGGCDYSSLFFMFITIVGFWWIGWLVD